MAAEMYKLSTECAACGGGLRDARQRYGRHKDFCSPECRNAGRAYCKACGKTLQQDGKAKKDFCNKLCNRRYYRVGMVTNSYIEERHRSTCKTCEKPIVQPRHGRKYFCNQKCSNIYYHAARIRTNHVEKWGQYAPETRKILLELDNARMPMTAKRLATAIDREYTPRLKVPTKTGWISHICKGCGKEFRRQKLSSLSKEYCSHKCQLNTEQKIESGRLKGEDNPCAKVIWEQVDEIRSLYASKQMTQHALGEKYGLGKSTIQNITSGKTWKPENHPRYKKDSNTQTEMKRG